MKNIIKDIKQEMADARKKFKKFHSAHEAYAVIKEKLEQAASEFVHLYTSSASGADILQILLAARLRVIQTAAMCTCALTELKYCKRVGLFHEIQEIAIAGSFLVDGPLEQGLPLGGIWNREVDTWLTVAWVNITERKVPLGLFHVAANCILFVAAIDTQIEKYEEQLTAPDNKEIENTGITLGEVKKHLERSKEEQPEAGTVIPPDPDMHPCNNACMQSSPETK